MKTLGTLGEMSPASTTTYYQVINDTVNHAKGANTTAPVIVYSVDFQKIVDCQRLGDWQTAGEILADMAVKLQSIGADGILLATNTMHKVAPAIVQAINVPFLSIIDATAHAICAKGFDKVALLGTAFVMEQDFYKNGLASFGIDCLVPSDSERADIHRIIFDELCVGVIKDSSKQTYLNIINRLKEQGAKGVISGCTEIGLLIGQDDLDLPVFDTAYLHAQMAVEFILKD